MGKKGPSFSLNDFKKWMDSQSEENARGAHVGEMFESKISLKKLLERIEPESGDLMRIAREFKRNGGALKQMDGNGLLIEVDSGTFFISKLFVKRQV